MLSEKIAITKPYIGLCERNKRLLQNCNRRDPDDNTGTIGDAAGEFEWQQGVRTDYGQVRA